MKLKQKIAGLMLRNTSFPNRCETGNELSWMLKDNCPVCVKEPIEGLSNEEYHKKYPANNKIVLGVTVLYMCDTHLEQLKDILTKNK